MTCIFIHNVVYFAGCAGGSNNRAVSTTFTSFSAHNGARRIQYATGHTRTLRGFRSESLRSG